MSYGPPPAGPGIPLPPPPPRVVPTSRMSAPGIVSMVLAGLAVLLMPVPMLGVVAGAGALGVGLSAVVGRRDTMGWVGVAAGATVLLVQMFLVLEL